MSERARIQPEIRAAVGDRANWRCEYCRIHEEDAGAPHHVEHVIAKQHDGADTLENLALACHHCNARKGPNLSGIDPKTSLLTPLFHPRRDLWADHFEWRGVVIVGMSAVGRVTVNVLAMNAQKRLDLRSVAQHGI